jgi:cytochrome c553
VLPEIAGADTPVPYVGSQVCAGCHTAQADQWQDSHHALATQEPTATTALGDFAGGRLEHFGVSTTFSRSDDKFVVRTNNGDSGSQDYEIAHAFGVYSLQQYPIAFPKGRLQALGVAWDSRPKDQGGQRQFSLYPDQKLVAGDRLRWTGRDQTWNYMCANCHSTNFQKNYDLSTDGYVTTWSM